MRRELSVEIKKEIKNRLKEAEDKLYFAKQELNKGNYKEVFKLSREIVYHTTRAILSFNPDYIKKIAPILDNFGLHIVQSGILDSKSEIVRYYIVFQSEEENVEIDEEKMLRKAKELFLSVKKRINW